MDIICTLPGDGEEEDDDETGVNTGNGDGTPAQEAERSGERRRILFVWNLYKVRLVGLCCRFAGCVGGE